MLSKIKKLPTVLIIVLLLAIGSSGFAYNEYKELQNFKDAGLFYDKNQKQVVLSPLVSTSNMPSRYIGFNELKEFLTYKFNCDSVSAFLFGGCPNINSQQNQSIYSSSSFFNPSSSYFSGQPMQNYNPSNESVKAKYYGWFGSDKVEFTINTPVQNFKYNGEYYSNSEKKTFNFMGNTTSRQKGDSYTNSIILDEMTDALITGKI